MLREYFKPVWPRDMVSWCNCKLNAWVPCYSESEGQLWSRGQTIASCQIQLSSVSAQSRGFGACSQKIFELTCSKTMWSDFQPKNSVNVYS